MYAYFGGASFFSDLLPWTGYLQLITGIGVDSFVIWDVLVGRRGCGDMSALRAHLFGCSLLVSYAVLFWGDVKGRGKTKKEDGDEGRVAEIGTGKAKYEERLVFLNTLHKIIGLSIH